MRDQGARGADRPSCSSQGSTSTPPTIRCRARTVERLPPCPGRRCVNTSRRAVGGPGPSAGPAVVDGGGAGDQSRGRRRCFVSRDRPGPGAAGLHDQPGDSPSRSHWRRRSCVPSTIKRTLATAGATRADVVSVDSSYVLTATDSTGQGHNSVMVDQLRLGMGERRPTGRSSACRPWCARHAHRDPGRRCGGHRSPRSSPLLRQVTYNSRRACPNLVV